MRAQRSSCRSLARYCRARRGLSGRCELHDACAGRTDTRGEPWRACPRRRDVRHLPRAVLQHALLACCNSMPFSRVVPSGQVALGKNSLRWSCFLAVEYLFGYHTGYPHTRLSKVEGIHWCLSRLCRSQRASSPSPANASTTGVAPSAGSSRTSCVTSAGSPPSSSVRC